MADIGADGGEPDFAFLEGWQAIAAFFEGLLKGVPAVEIFEPTLVGELVDHGLGFLFEAGEEGFGMGGDG